MQPKILLSHPNTAPFIQQAARALHELDMLHSYTTTIAYDPNSSWQRRLYALGGLGKYLDREFQRRTVSEVPLALVSSRPQEELVRLFCARILKSALLTDMAWQWSELSFDYRTARGLPDEIDGVYCYEHAALQTFREAQARNKFSIYDVPAPEHEFVHSILRRELSRFPEVETSYHRHIAKRQEQRTHRRRQEWQLADLVIAASQFTYSSYQQAGLDVSKVEIVPYGAPAPITADRIPQATPAQPLRFLWAGTISIRKGAHYLLRAWQDLAPGRTAELSFFGASQLPAGMLAGLSQEISFSSSIPRNELSNHYLASDALVFPTLCDGYGMVVSEALAHGLPVITTERAGAADLIEHGRNGFIIKAAEVDALRDILAWCIAHPRELRSMRYAARETALNWQWSDYRRELAARVQKHYAKKYGV